MHGAGKCPWDGDKKHRPESAATPPQCSVLSFIKISLHATTPPLPSAAVVLDATSLRSFMLFGHECSTHDFCTMVQRSWHVWSLPNSVCTHSTPAAVILHSDGMASTGPDSSM